jgi:iron(III) transport system substrate-binding protein
MRRDRRTFVEGCLTALAELCLGAGCRRSSSREAIVYTSVDQAFSEPVFKAFEARAKTTLRAVFDTEETKSTGVVNRLVAEARAPQADVFWSGDPVRPFLLAKRGMVERYASPNAADIPPAYRAADGAWTGFAARARILLVNEKRLAGAPAPRSVRDLAAPPYRGQAAMANPLFGTTTMHVASLCVAWGEDATRKFLRDVRANETKIASSNGEVKRLVVEGDVSFGLTDTDDAHEAIEQGAPVTVVYPDQDDLGVLVMPTSVVLIRGGPHPDAGRQLIDYLVSTDVERQLANTAAHMPVRAGVATAAGIRHASEVRSMNIDYGDVADAMERIQPWLREWVGL